MSHAKPDSKQKIRTKVVTVLGVTGALSLVAGVSAVGPAGDIRTKNTPPIVTLNEEEISDVSLATFYVFDNENAETHRPGLQFVRERRHRGSSGGGGAAYGGSAIYRGGGGYGCGGGCSGGGGPDGM